MGRRAPVLGRRVWPCSISWSSEAWSTGSAIADPVSGTSSRRPSRNPRSCERSGAEASSSASSSWILGTASRSCPVELDVASLVDDTAFEHGLLVTSTHPQADGFAGDQTLLAPAYVSTDDELAQIVDRFRATIESVERSIKGSLSAVGTRMSSRDGHGEEFVLLAIPDMNGSLRGKALRPAAFEAAVQHGTVMTDLIIGLDPVDTPITDYERFGIRTGAADLLLTPDVDTVPRAHVAARVADLSRHAQLARRERRATSPPGRCSAPSSTTCRRSATT